MKKVDRSELLDLGAYEQVRERFRGRIIELKKKRRLQLGEHMSFVFENHDTVLLQVQEMLRTERISDERSIAHELETYNELIPPAGSLSATHFIEYDDPVERAAMLVRFASLRDQVHLVIGGERATARFATHFGEEMDRLPAVNYLTFDVGAGSREALLDGSTPVMLESSHPDYSVSVEVTMATRRELANDLE